MVGHKGVLQQVALSLSQATGLLVEEQVARRFPRLVRIATGLEGQEDVPYIIQLRGLPCRGW